MTGSLFPRATTALPARSSSSLVRRTAFFLGLTLLAPFLAAAGDWQWASPTPTGNHLNSFAYGAGRFVGVGISGEIATSTDGATWTLRTSGTNESLAKVIYDGTRFMAISANNLLTSPDGVTWTKQTGPTGLLDLVFGNGRYVAIARSPDTQAYRFETSTDGSTWTSTGTLSQLLRVHFANGVFVAIADAARALSSTDGVAWTTTQLPDATGFFFSAAGNGRFLASYGTKTFVSTDGVTWRGVTSHPPADSGFPQALTVPYLDGGVAGSALGFAGGFFYIQQSRYASDAYRAYRSADGETWQPITIFQNADLPTFTEGGGTWVGSERTQLYYGINRANYAIHSSIDGLAWTARSSATIDSSDNLVYGLGRFFAGGKVSSDAVTWVAGPFGATHAAGERVFRISSKYEFSSSSSTIIDPRAITSVVASADGLTGTTVDVKMATPRAIAFGAGRYVVVGDGGKISSSADGFAWAEGSSGSAANLSAVIFAFNRFVAVGAAGTLLTSADGLAWTTQSAGTTLDFVSVAAGPDRIVVGTLGSSGAVPGFNLPGGVPVQIVATRRSDSLAWFDGEFTSLEYNLLNWPIAAGSFSLAKSTDGVTWTDESTRVPWGPKGMGRLAVGNDIELLLAPAGLDWGSSPLFAALIQKRKAGTAAPVVTHPPVATTVHQGETAQFSVGVTGGGTFTYQWQHDGAPIAGATSQVLTLPLTKDSDAGNYTVTVTSAYGSATSAPARLTIQAAEPLVITKQPVGGTVYELQSFYLTVEVSGSGPITYQWRRNGAALGTAMSSTYEIWAPASVLDNFTGDYDVVVTSPTSTVTSQAVTVTRAGPSVTITKSGGAGAGATLVLTANATGKGPFTYAWGRAGGQTFVGATDATLVLPNVISTDTSSYSVSVADADGFPGKGYATVQGPEVTPLPTQNRATTEAGQKLTLRAPVSSGDLNTATYQWRFGGNPIAGATNWSFTTPAISDSTVGDYSVVVTIGANVTTYTTTVSLGSSGPVPAPTFAAQTTGRTVMTGGGTTFAVSVEGGSVTSYQWQVSTNGGGTWTNVTDGGGYSGATTSVLSIANATAAMNNYQYRCVAGNGTTTITSAAATLAITNDPPLVHPVSVARDASGNLFVADASANVIRKVTPAGAVSVFAGTAGSAGSQDGTSAAARFNQPGGLAFDAAGNLYVADTGNALIRRITPAGAVTTLAGDASLRGNVDGTGNAARFNHPTGIAFDSSGNAYVSDTFTHTVRKVTSAGAVTTLAGANAVAGSADGPGAQARFNNPAGLAIGTDGALYVADANNQTIRKIASDGIVTTLAGLAGVTGSSDGTGNNALFSQPTSLAVDGSGNLYVADTGNASIRRVTPSGTVTLVAGVPGIAGFADGVGLDALFDQPRGIVLDGSTLVVTDTGNAALRKITANAAVTTLSLSIAPVTNPPPTTEPPPSQPATGGGSSGSSSAGGGGGGGAPSFWFVGALALLWTLRQRKGEPPA